MADDLIRRIEEIRDKAVRQAAEAGTSNELEKVRVEALGRKSELTGILRSIADLDSKQRSKVGGEANRARSYIESMLKERSGELAAGEIDRKLERERIDVTLPGDPPPPVGHLHLITQTRREVEDIFVGLGYRVLEGPEVEHDYYNFTALNHPEGHPARLLQDTFYFSDDILLRTHTSPMQIRAMEAEKPPLYVIVPGKAYRRDSDATHTPMFHQVEGLAVDENVTMADLQGTLQQFARVMFGPDRQLRLRPHYFPFTEPSVEVDVSCFHCDASGSLKGGNRCSLCKGVGWIEILGAGMVDPNVFEFVKDNGYDPEKVQGFAFGVGLERIAMLKHGIPDLRLFFENDLGFLEQF